MSQVIAPTSPVQTVDSINSGTAQDILGTFGVSRDSSLEALYNDNTTANQTPPTSPEQLVAKNECHDPKTRGCESFED